MKLREWAEKQGISYLTAWRWFKNKDPRLAKAYQSDSGTIIVPDENQSSEQNMSANNANNDLMSIFLKKTVEFSKNNSTVEDFAAWVLSNFNLKSNSTSDTPKYSKHKPKSEEVQKHFQQFLPNKEKEEHLKAVRTLLKENVNKAISQDLKELNLQEPDLFSRTNSLPANYSIDDFSDVLSNSAEVSDEHGFTDGLVTRSVDLNTTPQQINYTGSTSQAVSNSISIPLYPNSSEIRTSPDGHKYISVPTGPHAPYTRLDESDPIFKSLMPLTKKECESGAKVIEVKMAENLPRSKRGRKSLKKAE